MAPHSFSAKLLLKTRRPECFSDTSVEEITELDRSLLEFHLSSLTSRSQETDFERFARRLCEYEICPNLLPQTGPTGGGDSKVDSETYPVADSLVFAWFTGLGREASHERWGFAFSAKSDWRSKVQSDIAKIAGTARAYTKAFFVSNQAVPDRKRAVVEDGLRTKYGMDVRILDRTWILDRVFAAHHEKLAVNELGVTGLSRSEVTKGPLDVKREKALAEVEERIRESLQAGMSRGALVDDALRAANLARNLERPRTEIEGLFKRAERLAREFGSSRQNVEVAYQWAWTLYGWLEDYRAFGEQYGVVQDRAKGSRNVFDLERLTTLWFALQGAVGCGILEMQSVSFSTRTDALVMELNRFKEYEDRPSATLQAETLLLIVQLVQRLNVRDPPDDLLRGLQEVALRSKGLFGFSLKPLVEYLTLIGPSLEGLTAYDDLFETIVQVVSTRDSEITAARLLLERGEHQLSYGHPIKAIVSLGRALGRLHKDETRHLLVRALYLCGCAYDEIGLPWAARGTLLSAASIATDDFWRYGDVTPYQAACYRRLKRVELRLGRLPHILAWHELDVVLRQELVERGYDTALLSQEPEFDALFIRLLLRSDFQDLWALQKLPDALDRLGLDVQADALLYALGHKERLETVCKKLGEDPDVFASRGWRIKADISLPERPVLYDQPTVALHSRVLGCRINAKCMNDPPCVEVAESFLAALEGFLATCAIDRAIAREPEFSVEVRECENGKDPITISVEEQGGRPQLVILCQTFDPHNMPAERQNAVREAVFEAVATTLEQIVEFKDEERDLESLFRDERVSERAIAFTSTFGWQVNVLGNSPKTRLTSWFSEKDTVYTVRRVGPWQPVEVATSNMENGDITWTNPGYGSEPGLGSHNLRSHEQLEIDSLIRVRLWDRAGWVGLAFLTYQANIETPVVALIFRNQEAGRKIFEYWRQELGGNDERKRLRLTFVRGIDKAHPDAYRVVIGSNPTMLPSSTRYFSSANRIHQMNSTSAENLLRFIRSHAAVGTFRLAPAYAPPGFDGSQAPLLEMEISITMDHFHVRNAWEIGLGDMDSVAIQKEDDPIIPEDVGDVPVLELIRKLRSS